MPPAEKLPCPPHPIYLPNQAAPLAQARQPQTDPHSRLSYFFLPT